jgi:Domain of unknown function (DUF4167)
MRNGQNNKRMRGRNRGKGQNPLTRVYESNGPDVKIRGTASHVAEKYMQLARDAHSSGDPVAAENYFQHAEHYFRMIAAAQEQFRQTNPYYQQQQGNVPMQGAADQREEYEDSEDDQMGEPGGGPGEQPSFGTRDPQPYVPRDAQFYPSREQNYGGRQQHQQPRGERSEPDNNIDRLPSFITGGGAPQAAGIAAPQQQGQGPEGVQAHRQNGYDNNQGDRFHRRRRRHRGQQRHDGGPQGVGADAGGDEPAAPPGPQHQGD